MSNADDELSLWRDRVARTCGACGCRRVDDAGVCSACGARKAPPPPECPARVVEVLDALEARP